MDDDDFFDDFDDDFDDDFGEDNDFDDYEDDLYDEDDNLIEVPPVEKTMTHEEITEVLLGVAKAKGDVPYAVCRYGFADVGGFYVDAHTACVSQLSYPFGVGRPNVPGGIINWAYNGVPIELIQYATDPKVSPWKALIQKGFTLYTTPTEKTHAFIMTDLEHPAPVFASYMKAFRTYTEVSKYGIVATKLVQAGVHPGMALWVSQFFSQYYGNKPQLSMAARGEFSWHGSFLCNSKGVGVKALKNFINGVHTYDKYGHGYMKKPYTKNYQYSGCDWIFVADENEPAYVDYLKKTYADLIKEETSTGRFSKVTTGGWTIDTLITICKLETEKHGFEAYDYNLDR